MSHLITLLAVAAVITTTFTLGQFLVAASDSDVSNQVVTVIEFSAQPVPEAVTAQSVYVFDVETNIPLLERDSDTVRPIASITKLFSSAAFYKQDSLEQPITIVASDVATEGDAGRLEEGQTYSARELLFPALLESSNDAAVAQARVSERDLMLAMYAFANRYDATDVSFADTSGLSAENTASARSLARLVQALWQEQPQIFDITRLKQYVAEKTMWLNNSPFIGMEGYVGGKHGFTYEANRTATVFFSEPTAEGATRLVGYVLLGSADLRSDIELLRSIVQEM
jgi:serine-type D-Ala-D-Ala endopeptidase (penicillin-binding protein 7)